MRWKSEFSAQVNFHRSGTTDLLDAQKQVTVSAFTAFTATFLTTKEGRGVNPPQLVYFTGAGVGH